MPCLRIPVKVAGGSERSDAGKFMMKQGATFHRDGRQLYSEIRTQSFESIATAYWQHSALAACGCE